MRTLGDIDREYRSLADYQLARLIARGQDVAACQAEWARCWGQAYPSTRGRERGKSHELGCLYDGGDRNECV